MGMVIPLFPRQTLVGATDYYSEPFDMSPYESVNLEFRVKGLIGTNPEVLVQILTAAELSSDAWYVAKTFACVTSAPTVLSNSLSGGEMSQFVKAKLALGGTGPGVTCSLIGVAREAGS